MESVTSVNVHRFGNGLLLEVVGNDTNGEVHVRSVELDLVDPDTKQVRPRSPLPADGGGEIAEQVSAAGYELDPHPTNGWTSPASVVSR